MMSTLSSEPTDTNTSFLVPVKSPTVSVSPILKLPNELLSRILAYTVASDAPFQMDKWLVWTRGSAPFLPMSLLKSRDGYEKEHFLDWQLINATCRRFKECGIPEFFSEKIIGLSPWSVNALHHGHCSNLSPDLRAVLLARCRHVVADMLHLENGSSAIDSNLGALPDYNCFPHLRSISIAIQCVNLFIFRLSRTISRWYQEATCATRDINIPERSTYALERRQVPEKLIRALQKIGLETKGVTIDVVLPDRPDLWLSFFDDLEHDIPPKLEELAETRARTTAVRGLFVGSTTNFEGHPA